MSLYTYTAKDSQGETKSGTVDARTLETAVGLLKSQGLFVVDIEKEKSTFIEQVLSFKGVSTSDIVAFTRQFSTMISAGLPISRSLEVLANQTQNKTFSKITLDVLRSIEGGTSLSSALERYPNVFSTTYRSLVAAGETSGKLDEILKRLADTMEAERELNSKFKAAMVYPAVVMVAMVGVTVVLMVFVIPKLADMYDRMNVSLPVITQIMISISTFMSDNLLLMFGLTVATILGFRYSLKTEVGKEIFTAIMFKVPVFGKINKQKEVTQFARTLSLLISAAIPIVEGLETVGDIISHAGLKKAIFEAARQVEKGNSLSEYFKTSPEFPPLLGQMAGVGEETGKMDEVLEKVAEYYDSEVNHLVKGLSAALEPIILIMLGAMVGFLIISIITPIYKLTTAL